MKKGIGIKIIKCYGKENSQEEVLARLLKKYMEKRKKRL